MPLPEFLLPYLARQCECNARDGLLSPGDDGRHTAASLAVSAGANVKAVQKMLGHASAAMALDFYADLFDEHPSRRYIRGREGSRQRYRL